MDSRSTAAESKHSYSPAHWPHTPPVGTTTAGSVGSCAQPEVSAGPLSAGIEYLPFFLPQQATFFHHQQLLQYNKLVSPGRGGGHPQLPAQAASSPPHTQTAPRSRSASKVSNKDHPTGKGNQGGHGNRAAQNNDKGPRAVIANKDAPPKMPPKNPDLSHPLPARPAVAASHNQNHSSSVPSTPLQHARGFSFESREPSPNAANSHSPRSAYSETTAQVPPLKQLPPRLGGCQYETAQMNTRRRIPYSIGNERLERISLSTVKSRLTEDEERKLTTDMRELYDRLLPTDAVEKKRRKLVTKLEKIFNDEWPGHDIRVHLFGSSGNLLCSDDSDVDICITTEWKELEGVCMIAELLARRGMEKVVCIAPAKVPIVKMWDPELGLACDMNVNNTLALENTRMVRTYVEIDERVRPLAMIVKYWTRRRVVNDAAFGGTLSSYTWICLVIAFLQLRDPAVLPALHQRPHQRLRNKDGVESVFADDLDQLRGFGKKNKSSLGDLLFEFFRFYAHEFDYDKHSLSVRLGHLLTKKEKNWHHALNNRLCIEEPFNTTRNLGNTADEYSFKGLHLELRRAFELISQAKLTECCDQYVFPKEEERVFTQTRKPQPILMRSSSQTHSGRGGRSGFGRGRHSNNHYRGNNANRRASSSVTYDGNTPIYSPHMNGQDLSWYGGGAYVPQDPLQAALAMQLQRPDMHGLLYQNQILAQVHAYQQSQQQNPQQKQSSQGQQQRVPGSSGQTDRSRTNSFDNPPLTAPLRPELFGLYGVSFQPGQPFYAPSHVHQVYGTYPSTPAATTGAPTEFRRSLHRSSAAAEAGTSGAGSSLRSQSQPASRSVPAAQPGSGSFSSTGPTPPNGLSIFPPRNNANGIPIPSFISDEAEFDEGPPPSANAAGDPPPSDEGGHARPFLSETSSPSRRVTNAPNGIAFGDLHQPATSRRHMSTELPQSVLDRRMRRVSRSPSPAAGHARALSVGTSSPSSLGNKSNPRPLVVNGSLLNPTTINSHRQTAAPSPSETYSSGDSVSTRPSTTYESGTESELTPVLSSATTEQSSLSLPEQPPVVVNGTNTGATAAAGTAPAAASPSMPSMGQLHMVDEPSFKERLAMMNPGPGPAYGVPSYFYQPDLSMNQRYTSSTRQRVLPRQQQSGIIAPLDLAIDYKIGGSSGQLDFQHLSPVYENRTPPAAPTRRSEHPTKGDRQGQAAGSKGQGSEGAGRAGLSKPSDTGDTTALHDSKQPVGVGRQPQYKSNRASQPGHQSSKSQTVNRFPGEGQEAGGPRESEGRTHRSDVVNGDGGWQRAGKYRKKGGDHKNQGSGMSQSEAPPKHSSERKGG